MKYFFEGDESSSAQSPDLRQTSELKMLVEK